MYNEKWTVITNRVLIWVYVNLVITQTYQVNINIHKYAGISYILQKSFFTLISTDTYLEKND